MAPVQPTHDYYVTLEVGVTAPYDEIRAAYRRLALKYHPDKNSGSQEATRKFQRVRKPLLANLFLSNRINRLVRPGKHLETAPGSRNTIEAGPKAVLVQHKLLHRKLLHHKQMLDQQTTLKTKPRNKQKAYENDKYGWTGRGYKNKRFGLVTRRSSPCRLKLQS